MRPKIARLVDLESPSWNLKRVARWRPGRRSEVVIGERVRVTVVRLPPQKLVRVAVVPQRKRAVVERCHAADFERVGAAETSSGLKQINPQSAERRILLL